MSVRRRLLLPLVPVYAAGLGWKRRRESGSEPKRLRGPVISVGSLSAGGAGKTPMVLCLADLLRRHGLPVRILTRGYGRESQAVERVDPAGDARRYGDEPLLLARRSGVPVYVGADRWRAGLMAEEEEGLAVNLLDDGFQHRKLGREMDLVLLTRRDVEDVLLPAGNLREPLVTLREADVVVVREEEAEALRGRMSALMGAGAEALPVWTIRRRLRFAEETAHQGQRLLAFCGIARPEGFYGMLETAGRPVVESVSFGDHHRYRDGDVARLLRRAGASGADGFVTTEKDAVKLSDWTRRRLEEVGPLLVPELHVELVNEREAMELMMVKVPGVGGLRLSE